MLINFFVIQLSPGGPVDRFIIEMNHASRAQQESVKTEVFKDFRTEQNLKYQQSGSISEEIIEKIKKLYNFDLPIHERFFLTIKKFLVFDFGVSFYQDKKVIDLIYEKLPISISLGLWSLLITYLISIPLGIKKAVNDGSKFDISTSSIIIVLYAIPAFIFAIFLIIIFAGGNFLQIFPLRGITSENFAELNMWQKICDYFWHLILPLLSIVIGGFASLTFFCKNSILEELSKQYVVAAYAKGLNQKQVLYYHVFRNAMLIVISTLPSALIGILFTNSLLIEVIFSLDGIGLLGYEAVISRDYPIIFASLYIFTLVGLINSIICDLTYKIIDPRISFDKN